MSNRIDHYWALSLCRAAGVSVEGLSELQINVSHDKPTTITAKYWVRRDVPEEGVKFNEFTHRFKLVSLPIEDDIQPDILR